jgi:hypothetical protein
MLVMLVPLNISWLGAIVPAGVADAKIGRVKLLQGAFTPCDAPTS